ncbi:MAG: hypothetical protein ACRCXZ_10315 [Patescibacteria group bacterium]
MPSEEDKYLREVKSTKPRICDPPLYKLCGSGGQYKRSDQEGGFLGAIIPMLRIASPYILDFAISKFTGNGLEYRKSDKSPLSDNEKRALLLNIMLEYPHLQERLFQ